MNMQETEIIQLPERRTQEEIDCAEYKRLGVEISNLIAEREALKAEMIPAIREGVTFEYQGQTLIFEYSTRTDFDWERFVKEQMIPVETFQPYIKTTVVEALQFRKIQDSGEAAFERYKSRMARTYDIYKARREAAKKMHKNKVIK